MLSLIGLPIFFLELAIGQYAGLGPIEAFQRISPFFHGECSDTWCNQRPPSATACPIAW